MQEEAARKKLHQQLATLNNTEMELRERLSTFNDHVIAIDKNTEENFHRIDEAHYHLARLVEDSRERLKDFVRISNSSRKDKLLRVKSKISEQLEKVTSLKLQTKAVEVTVSGAELADLTSNVTTQFNDLDLNASLPDGFESEPMVTYNVDPHKIHSLECDFRKLSLVPETPGLEPGPMVTNNVDPYKIHSLDCDLKKLSPVPETPQLDFTTKSINVRVYKADITIVETCAIVSSANMRLKHKGSVAAAIARKAGPDLERECKEYIKKHGALKVTDVVHTISGKLPCMMVLHAVGPRWGDYRVKDKNLCQILLAKTVLNCLETANNRNYTALTLSAIGAGKNGIPKDVCAQMYLAAIQKFAQKHGNNSILKKIHFVDINDDTVTAILDIFSRYWDSEIKLRNGEKIVWD